jgi:sugar/nucleoside kinase (ribokinase family)
MKPRTDRTGVVSVGRLYIDMIFTGLPRQPSLGTEIYADGFSIHAGGGACITAAHLSALGCPTYLAAFLPGAPFDQTIRDQLEAAGVLLEFAQRAGRDQPPQVTAALVAGGDRAFVTHRHGPAAPRLDPARLRAAGIGHMHIGELATLVEMPELLTVARAADLTVSLDCSWDETLKATDVAQLIAGVDVFLPNAAEASRLSAIGVADPFAPLTVVKEGDKGARAHHQGVVIRAATTPVKPVDTTGAGDAFNAGFLSRWMRGASVQEALQAGNIAGGKAVQTAGGFALRAAPAAARQTDPA